MYLGDVKKIVHAVIDEIDLMQREAEAHSTNRVRDKQALATSRMQAIKRKLVPIVCEHPASMAVPQNSPGETITVKCGECGHEGELEYKYDDIDWR